MINNIDKRLISIITINYNNRFGLLKTINSVLLQSYKNIQYIVIDGGSNDGSKELILEFKDNIDYFVSENDNGIYHAMNKGIEVAKGEYTLFLNSGDFFVNNTSLEVMSKELYNADVVYGNVIYTGGAKQKYKGQLIYDIPKSVTLMTFVQGSLPHNCSFIITALLKVRKYDENFRIAADMEWFVSLMVKGGIFKYVNEKIIFYDTLGLSSKPGIARELLMSERKVILSKYFPDFILNDYCTNISSYSYLSRRIEKLPKHIRTLLALVLDGVLIIIEYIVGLRKLGVKTNYEK